MSVNRSAGQEDKDRLDDEEWDILKKINQNLGLFGKVGTVQKAPTHSPLWFHSWLVTFHGPPKLYRRRQPPSTEECVGCADKAILDTFGGGGRNCVSYYRYLHHGTTDDRKTGPHLHYIIHSLLFDNKDAYRGKGKVKRASKIDRWIAAGGEEKQTLLEEICSAVPRIEMDGDDRERLAANFRRSLQQKYERGIVNGEDDLIWVSHNRIVGKKACAKVGFYTKNPARKVLEYKLIRHNQKKDVVTVKFDQTGYDDYSAPYAFDRLQFVVRFLIAPQRPRGMYFLGKGGFYWSSVFYKVLKFLSKAKPVREKLGMPEPEKVRREVLKMHYSDLIDRKFLMQFPA